MFGQSGQTIDWNWTSHARGVCLCVCMCGVCVCVYVCVHMCAYVCVPGVYLYAWRVCFFLAFLHVMG